METDAKEWHLDNFYLSFEDELLQNEPWSQTNADRQQQSQLVSSSHNEVNPLLMFHEIPDYLLASSSSFRIAFFDELNRYYNAIDFKGLQRLAYLTHQMSIIHLHKQLWCCCLQAGTGQIEPREQPCSSHYRANITFCHWPELVTSVMISKGMIDHQTQDKCKHDTYVSFVQNYLQQLEKKSEQCRLQFNNIQNGLLGYTDQLNDKIDHYVQKEGLNTMRLHFESRIALIKYISIDRSYQMEYLQRKPTDAQV